MLLCGMDMGSGWGGGCGINPTSIALLLIALGIGAIVKYKAIKATSCQMFGKVIGYFIMIVAALGLVCAATCAYKAHCSGKKSCHEGMDVKEKGKSMEGMQLPPGHPDISTMKAPQQAPSK